MPLTSAERSKLRIEQKKINNLGNTRRIYKKKENGIARERKGLKLKVYRNFLHESKENN